MSVQPGSEASLIVDTASDDVAELPILVLNAHSRCNCRCVMCDIWKREEGTQIGVGDLEKHRESLRRLSVRWVVLSGGEPLLHGDLKRLCTFFRDLDIKLTLLTTGLLLTKRAAEVSEFFDDVIVSLDGPEVVHDSIRRVSGAFDLIHSGIKAVRQYRPSLRVAGRTTVQKANHRNLQQTVESAKTLAMDSISFLAADVTSEAFNRPTGWSSTKQSTVALTIEELKALEQEIESLIVNFAIEIQNGYIAENASKLRRITKHFRAHLGMVEHESPPCNAPWVSAVIEADGMVRPCFFHPPIGNMHQSTLEEVINGERARTFRQNLAVSTNPICRRCVCALYREKPASRSPGQPV
jgi:MoaA/NifB/PqqE/SkfB family radical SAM enzyme